MAVPKYHFWREGLDTGPTRPLTRDDDVVALDNTAFREGNEWKAEYVLSVYSKEDAEKLREKAEDLLKFFHIDPESVLLDRIGSRMKFFFAVPRTGVEVTLKGDNGMEFVVGPTLANGILSYMKQFGEGWSPPGGSSKYTVIGSGDQEDQYHLETTFAEETGWGIISG